MNDELRRAHLAQICKWVETYVAGGRTARVQTVHGDADSLGDLVKQLDGKTAIVLTLDDWAAFCEIMEPTRLSAAGRETHSMKGARPSSQ